MSDAPLLGERKRAYHLPDQRVMSEREREKRSILLFFVKYVIYVLHYGKMNGILLSVYSRSRNIQNERSGAAVEKHPADILEEEETFEQTSEDLDRMIEQTRSVVIRRKGEEELEKLTPRAQDVIRKIYLEGMKYKDVADELGISVATVNSILVRALKKLRQRSDNNDKLAIYLFFLEKSLISEQ